LSSLKSNKDGVMRKTMWLAAFSIIFCGTSIVYADIVPPPEEGLSNNSLLYGLPLLALVAGSYFWFGRKKS